MSANGPTMELELVMHRQQAPSPANWASPAPWQPSTWAAVPRNPYTNGRTATRSSIEALRGVFERCSTSFVRCSELSHAFEPVASDTPNDRRKPIIVYTDASSDARRTSIGLGFIDTESRERLMSADVTPPALLQPFGERGSVIHLAELQAIPCAVLTFGERLRDHDVMCLNSATPTILRSSAGQYTAW